jgi:hypothetical protein
MAITEVNIIRLLLYNEKFQAKTFVEMSSSLFSNSNVSDLYELIKNYYIEQSSFPSNNIKLLIYNNIWNNPENVIEDKIKMIDVDPEEYNNIDIEPILPEVEKWIKRQRFYNVLINGIDDWEKSTSKNEEINLSRHFKDTEDIMGFSFSKEEGLDLFDNEKIFEMRKTKDKKIRSFNPVMNDITKGGINVGSINFLVGGPNTGKTRGLVSLGVDYLRESKDNKVLYVTLEIPMQDIVSRIESNILDISEDELNELSYDEYIVKKEKYQNILGRMKIEEFPTRSLTISKLRGYLNNLAFKGFRPNIVIIDYMTIMKTEYGKNVAGHEAYKLLSEDLRGLAGEMGFGLWTGAQLNRTGHGKKNGAGLDDLASAFDIAATGDLMIFIVSNPELAAQNKQMLIVKKTRYDKNNDTVIFADIHEHIYKIDFIDSSNAKKDEEAMFNANSTSVDLNKFNHNDDRSENGLINIIDKINKSIPGVRK